MFYHIFSFLLLLPLALTASSHDSSEQISYGALPDWVVRVEVPLQAEAKSSQANLQWLLIDKQKHFEEKTIYYHEAIRGLSPNGIDAISQLTIDFDPSYERVIVHKIEVHRNGAVYDRSMSRHHLLQREEELDFNIYNGELTLVYFLEDVREGDVVEFAYSVIGEHPFLSTHLTDFFYLENEFALEKNFHRIIADQGRQVQVKSFNTAIEPQVNELGSSLREWIWDVSDTPAMPRDFDEPSWYDPLPLVQVSEYESWKEVSAKFATLFHLPEDFAPSSEMMGLVDNWMASSQDPQRLALAALRFVQDEIRYLGFEEGICGVKPSHPNDVLQRRFGDCKDKSLLLHTLLKLMGISSTPVGINTVIGKRLPELLPAMVFNHAVLQIQIENESFWADATFHSQGGSLQNTYFPDFGWALLLSKDAQGLSQIVPKEERPLEFETSITFESEDLAHLVMSRSFYDHRADVLRQILKEEGFDAFSEERLFVMLELYGDASFDSEVYIIDDRENNAFTLIESYSIPTQVSSVEKVLKAYSFSIRNYLDAQFNAQRTAPYSLFSQFWIKEHIHIENPFHSFSTESKEYTYEHESLYYHHARIKEENVADLYYELKYLQDYVPQESLKEYLKIARNIKRHSSYTIKTARLFDTELQRKITSQGKELESSSEFKDSLGGKCERRAVACNSFWDVLTRQR